MITDEYLIDLYSEWNNHYWNYGDSHSIDMPSWKIAEIYHDKVIDRVLEALPEMSDEENEAIVERLNNLV